MALRTNLSVEPASRPRSALEAPSRIARQELR